ncbi:MAG TPA: PQQ-binding-like beta-propeller repeat protein, partial [Caulifigura sp.]|nr:PQQ-binding-like beta-propeller repeat protein [Caulifigura sp.]
MSDSVVKPRRRGPGNRLPLWTILLLFLLSNAAQAQNNNETPAQGPAPDLSQFLKDLFEPAPKKMDLIDRHAAAASRELSRNLEQSDALVKTQQWNAAIEQLQYVLELPEDALVQRPGGWASLKRAAERRVMALPEEGRRAYLNQYSAVAAEELKRALDETSFDGLVRVASRFRLTPAGQTAANEVISQLADAGDFVAAAQWVLELEQDRSPLADTGAWKARKGAIWLALGRDDVASATDASTVPSANPPTAIPARGWTEIYGGPARTNSVIGDQPLLLEEWSSKSSQVSGLQDEIEQRQTDLFAATHRPIPVANAVTSGSLLAFRSAAGLEVRNSATGDLQWRARGRSTVESQFGRTNDLSGGAMILGPGDNQESHPLTSYFYRDAVLGQLSTDGRRIFAISRAATLLSSGYDIWAPEPNARQGNRSFNSIVAVDFGTGRRLWTTGGSKDDAPFESPLAGVYFFGPPTVDGDELFVIGASAADIVLYCLEASTGLPKWRQFIAQYDTTKIDDDFVRQMWSCTPTVTRGVVYCPTNAGWFVAVDRCRRRLAWATRYSASEISDRYQPQYSLSGVNERWAPTAPIVTNGMVVFAPPELPDEPMQTEPQLFRMDAVTGKVTFKRGKTESIAVAGVSGENVLVLGSEGLESWPPALKWSRRWSTPYPKGLTPCGMGVAINGVYWLPCLEGAVVGYRLSDGAIEQVLKNDALAGRLGNLIADRNRVYSAGPTGLVGLWQKKPFEQQLAERLARNPRDLESRLRKAKGLFSEQHFDEALKELESADLADGGSSAMAAEGQNLLWECLVRWLADPGHNDVARWSRARSLAET